MPVAAPVMRATLPDSEADGVVATAAIRTGGGR
jgi:hypothetical protein